MIGLDYLSVSWLTLNSFRGIERSVVDFTLFLYLIFCEFYNLLYFSGDVLPILYRNKGDVVFLHWSLFILFIIFKNYLFI